MERFRNSHQSIFPLIIKIISLVFAFAIVCNVYAENITAESVIPAYSASCVVVSDVPKIADAMEKSPVWQEIGKYAKEQMKKDNENSSFMTKLAINHIWDLITISTEQIAIANIDPTKMSSPTVIIDLGSSKNLVETAQKIIQILVDEKKSEIVTNAGTYLNVSYGIVKPESRFAFLENLFVFAPGQKEFEAVVNVYRDKEPSIMEDPKYITAYNKVFRDGQAFLYFNSELTGSVSKILNQQEQLKALGTGAVKAISWRIDLLSPTKDQEIFFLSGDNQKIMSHLLSMPGSVLSPHIIPASSSDIFFALTASDIASAWDIYLDQLRNSLDIEQYSKFQETISNFEMGLGLNLKNDVLSSITGEFGVSVSMPKAEGESFSPTSGLLLFLGIKDREKCQLIVEKILVGKQIEKTQYKNVDIYHIKSLDNPQGLFGYTFAGDLLIFGGMKNLMAIIDEDTPLIASERFSQIGSRLPQSYAMLFYIDLAKLLALRAAPLAQGGENWANMMQSLGSIGGCSVFDGQGYRMKITANQGKSWLEAIGDIISSTRKESSTTEGGEIKND